MATLKQIKRALVKAGQTPMYLSEMKRSEVESFMAEYLTEEQQKQVAKFAQEISDGS